MVDCPKICKAGDMIVWKYDSICNRVLLCIKYAKEYAKRSRSAEFTHQEMIRIRIRSGPGGQLVTACITKKFYKRLLAQMVNLPELL